MQGTRDLLIRYISPALPLWALVPNTLARTFGGGHYMLWDLRTGFLCCYVFVFALRFRVEYSRNPLVCVRITCLPAITSRKSPIRRRTRRNLPGIRIFRFKYKKRR